MKVLIAIDGSPGADVALRLVTSMAWPSPSQIRVVVAVEPIPSILSAALAPGVAFNMDEQNEQLVDGAEAILDDPTRRLAETGADVSRHVLRGRPATAIVEAAREFGAELVVVGSRGHGRIGSMLLGSVSAEVSDHAPCPVLVARSAQLTRVVLAADGSEHALRAEQLVAQWPMFEPAAIEVTTVAPTDRAWRETAIGGPYLPMSGASPDVAEQVVADHRQLAADAAARLVSAGRRAAPRVVEGDPAAELIRVAREGHADLIALGSHGRTGLTRLLLGSVARNVLLHAPCSVLIARQSS